MPWLTHERRRAVLTTGLAVGLHVPALLVGVRAGAPRTAQIPAEPSSRAPEEPVEIELAPMVPVTSSPPGAIRDERLATTSTASRTPRRGASLEAAPLEATTEGTPPVAPEASGAPVMLFMPPSPHALGIGGQGPNAFVPAGPPPDAARGARAAVEGSLAAGLSARDQEVGLGPEGPVLRALEEASYGGLAPDRGDATFLAVVDAKGIVIDLRLLSSNGSEAGWADARSRAARALAGQKLSLRATRGVELRITVASDIVLPSGSRPSRPVTPVLEHSRIVTHENAPSIGTTDVTKAYTVGRFDLADVGAKPRRVVHARVLSLTAF